MKILYISYSTIPSKTANSIHVMKMCNALAELGHEVILIAPDGVEVKEKNVQDVYEYYGVKNRFNIHKVSLSVGKLGSIKYALSIAVLLFKFKPDLVFGRYCLGCCLSASLGFRTIFESHIPFKELTANDQKLLNFAVKHKNFKKLVVISEALKERFVEDSPLGGCVEIQVAHDGADNYLDDGIRPDLYGHKDKLKFGYIGHLYKGRGIDLLVEIARNSQDIEVHIVGGTDEDVRYWKVVVQSSALNNVFFYGHVSPTETKNYRAAFDVLLAPYSKKVTVSGNKGDTSAYMSPLKIFEYMAHKKPILCSDLPVLREVLNDQNAVLVEPDEISSWLDGIERLKDKATRDEIAERSYSDFKRYYTWYNRANSIVDSQDER